MSLRIMLVEDEAIIALDVRDILESAGHTVVGHVTTFADALILAAKTKPRVAILDVGLASATSGLEAATALHEQFGILALFLTGRQDFLVRAMALDFEPLGYVTKPYQPDDILRALAGVR